MQPRHRRIAFGAVGIAAAAALALTGCSGSGGGGSDTRTFELTTHANEDDIMSQVDQRFIDEVAERTDGRITINANWAGSLVPPDKVLDSTENGTVDIGHLTTSFASGAIPDLGILEVPFARPAVGESYIEFNDDVNPILDELFVDHNQKFLYSNPAIQPGIIACKNPVGDDGDLTGKLVRTAGPWQAAAIEAWGGTSATIGTADLYNSLQNGTVDCTLMVYNLYESLKLPEVAPYVYRFEFGANYQAINMNMDAWNSLSEEDQTAFLEAGAAAQSYAFELLDSSIEPVVTGLESAGAKFCRPSDASIEKKVDAIDKVRDEIAKGVTERGEKLLEISKNYRDDAIQAPEFGPVDPC